MYQHFVPQFLLRNFSHPFVDEESNESKVKKRRKKAKHPKAKPFPGDPVVHSAALSEDPIKLVETTVKRILGQMDMYRDTSQPLLTQNHIEDMFSQIESRVSTIFRKITKAFDAGDPGLWLTRKERNDVRKFLFLLKYRGSRFHRRFDHPTPEEYDENDKELFQEYMSQKGFTRPISVWFDNLKSIMELEMDAAGEWMDKIRRKIYHSDAEWFITHTQSFYMAICTPEDPSDEFVITDRCNNVFEGRNRFAIDAGTGQVDPVTYISLHEFAPISPKLMIVLRNLVFPLPDEDADPKTKEDREDLRARAVDNIFGPETLENSLLFSLPIKKARNSYSASVNGRLRLVGGEDGTHKLSHKFLFNFFRIEQTHVHKINGVFFDNAFTCTNIVFASRDSFLRSLEWYMTAAPEVIGKRVALTDGGQRLHYFQKLDVLMKALGSNKKSVWDETPLEGLYHREFHRFWMTYIARETQNVTNDPSLPLSRLLSTYLILGGSPIMFWDDLAQSRRMFILRVKIDSWSQGVDEDIRQRNRELLTEGYLRSPPWRFWIYMKIVKFFYLVIGDNPPGGINHNLKVEDGLEDVVDGIEDIVATTRLLVKDYNDCNRIIYATVTNEIEMKIRAGFNIWQSQVLTWVDLPRVILIMKLAFELPGPICRCCIPEIEFLSLVIEDQLRYAGCIEVQGFDSTPFTEDQVIEIVTRIKVRGKFIQMLEGKMKPTKLAELKRVFFEFTYPTPPTSES